MSGFEELESAVEELIGELPEGFIPRPEKLLIFVGAFSKRTSQGALTLSKETIDQIVVIAKEKGIQLDYSFPYSSRPHSDWLESDLYTLADSGLIKIDETITPTEKGWVVIDTFNKHSPAARKLFQDSLKFAEELEEMIKDNEYGLDSIARRALRAILS